MTRPHPRVVACVDPPPPSPALAITVPDDFPTIQAALNAAVPGDTVSAKDTPGSYHEKISVGRVKNSSFVNNTCYQNDTLGAGFGELWIQYAEDNVVRNNVFHATAQNLLLYAEAGNVNNALDYNLWFAAGPPRFVWHGTEYAGFAAYRTASGEDATSAFGDPQFLAPEAADFHLKASSPAVNAGDPAFIAGAGETDIDGAPRVNGARVDAGADELSCGDGVTDPGETCDDGNLIDCDGCDGADAQRRRRKVMPHAETSCRPSRRPGGAPGTAGGLTTSPGDLPREEDSNLSLSEGVSSL